MFQRKRCYVISNIVGAAMLAVLPFSASAEQGQPQPRQQQPVQQRQLQGQQPDSRGQIRQDQSGSVAGMQSPATQWQSVQPGQERVPHKNGYKEDKDGDLQKGEYEVISMNGSITRAFCPYTCDMRGVPQRSCKVWKSATDPNKCYVQDNRIPSNAVPIS